MSQQTTTATNRASVMHAVIHAWYMSGLISRSDHNAVSQYRDILELHCIAKAFFNTLLIKSSADLCLKSALIRLIFYYKFVQ